MGKFTSVVSDGSQCAVIDLSKIAGHLTDSEKTKLQSGDGFVKVPSEELSRLRVDVYPYLI